MFVINHKAQLFERVVIENNAENGDKKEFEYEYIPVESPPLRPRLRADGRFFLTREGQVYDALSSSIIPYSSDSNNPSFIDLVEEIDDCISYDEDGDRSDEDDRFVERLLEELDDYQPPPAKMRVVKVWLLREDKTLLSYTPAESVDGEVHYIRHNSEVINRAVDSIGRSPSGELFYIANNHAVILDDNDDNEYVRLKIESPIVDFFNGYPITENELVVPVYREGCRLVKLPFPEHREDYQLLTVGTFKRLANIDYDDASDMFQVLVFERVNGEIQVRFIEAGITSISGRVFKLSNTIYTAFDKVLPWVGGTVIDDVPYIFNREGLLLTSLSEDEVIADESKMNNHVFKSVHGLKNARKI